MPKVPTYDQPTEQQQELPGVRQDTPRHILNLAELGPGENVRLGNQMQSAGAQLSQIAAEQQHIERTAQVTDSIAQLTQASTGILHDPDSGYLNTSGKNAVDGRQATIETLQKQQQAIADQITDDGARAAFQREAAKHMAAATLAIDEHASRQTKQYAFDSSQSSASVNRDAAIASYNPMPGADNSIYVQSIQKQEAELNKQADILGLDGDARKQYIMYGHDGKSGTVATMANVVTHLVENNQTAAAQDYFSRVQGDLPPAAADNLRQVLQVKGRQDAEVTVQRALEKLPGDFKDKYAALNDAFDNKKPIAGITVDGTTYKAVKAGLENSEAHARQADNQQEASLVGAAQDWVMKHPGAPLSDMPASMYRGLQDKGHLAALDSFAKRENVTNPVTWFNVQTHIGDGSDRDITKMSDAAWLNLRGSMSDADFKRWTVARDDALHGESPSRDDPGNLHMAGFNAALTSRLAQIGVNPKNMTSDSDKARLGGLQQMAAQWVLDDQAAAGHRFTQAETAKSLDKLFASNVTVQGWFSNNTKRLAAMRFGDIPKSERNGIRQVLIEGGNEEPSEQDILNQYWRFHGRH